VKSCNRQRSLLRDACMDDHHYELHHVRAGVTRSWTLQSSDKDWVYHVALSPLHRVYEELFEQFVCSSSSLRKLAQPGLNETCRFELYTSAHTDVSLSGMRTIRSGVHIASALIPYAFPSHTPRFSELHMCMHACMHACMGGWAGAAG